MLRSVSDHSGKVFFIPGNQEWADGRSGGREEVRRIAAKINAAFGEKIAFLPENGFPGPYSLSLTENLQLIVLDTQWWLSKHRITGDTGEYELKEPTDFLLALENELYRHRNDQILMVGHHPVFSNGNYGGKFSFGQHMTPLPIVGSIWPLYRTLVGQRQDMASERYRLFRTEMQRLLSSREDLIYAAAHDHSLQYFRQK